ncbi:hypothetical protein Tco_1383913 [Tanacetum coccineum]
MQKIRSFPALRIKQTHTDFLKLCVLLRRREEEADSVREAALRIEGKHDEVIDPVYDCRKSLNTTVILGQIQGVIVQAIKCVVFDGVWE